jgi:alkylation response protein AidB-like acyl-CoA dehydrogenase
VTPASGPGDRTTSTAAGGPGDVPGLIRAGDRQPPDSGAEPDPARAWLDRVEALAPLIAASADQGERDRRLPEPLVSALVDAGLFRLLLPRSLGGAEADPVTFVRVLEAVSRVDASTAWCLCQLSGCSMTAGYLDPDVARAIFGEPGGMLGWGPAPDARAVAVDGGYRVTGRWSFASGGHHATWLGGYCQIQEPDGQPRRKADGSPAGRTMLFPAGRATWHDTWHVIGLRATGSDTYTVSDLFVPHAQSVARDDPAERRHPGLLYCFTTENVYACGFAGVALGLARSTLDAFVALARDKTPRGFRHTLRESTVVQAQVARAEAQLGAARAYLLDSLAGIWEAAGRAGALALDQRVRIRLAATHAIQEARQVVDTAYHAAGATAIFEGGAFERRFRDMHAVAQHVQGRPANFETAGQFLLGLPPDTTFL